MKFSRQFKCFAAAVIVGVTLHTTVAANVTNPDALWHIVHDQCAVAVAPCVLVDDKERQVFYRIPGGIQVLAMPIDKITGVEDPALLKPETPNFFADAWDRRSLVLSMLPKPISRDSISLVVNAQTARSQNQLHIHIDCLSAETRDDFRKAATTATEQWALIGFKINGHDFLARKVKGPMLDGFNPFLEIAKTLKDPTTQMYRQNVIVVGAEFSDGPGFLAITDTAPAEKLGYGSGENVQDHDCKVAR